MRKEVKKYLEQNGAKFIPEKLGYMIKIKGKGKAFIASGMLEGGDTGGGWDEEPYPATPPITLKKLKKILK